MQAGGGSRDWLSRVYETVAAYLWDWDAERLASRKRSDSDSEPGSPRDPLDIVFFI